MYNVTNRFPEYHKDATKSGNSQGKPSAISEMNRYNKIFDETA